MNQSYECHGHLMMDGIDFATARARHKNGVDTGALRLALSALSSAGIRYFRDGGDAYGVSVIGRKIASEYEIEVVTPVFAIYKHGHYGSIVGKSYDDIPSFRHRIAELREAKGDFVKLMLSGIITFKAWGDLSCDGLDFEEIKELVHISHEEGYSVMAHVNGAKTIRAAALAGVDSIEHGYFADYPALEAMAENHTFWVPTLAATEAFMYRENIDSSIAQKTLETQLLCLAKAKELGIPVAAGSDSGAVGVPHGNGSIREYELLYKAGFSATEIYESNEKLRIKFRTP